MKGNNMEIITIIFFVLLATICLIGVFRGLNPNKWTSWIYGICGLLCGLLIGSLVKEFTGGFILGAIIALAVMFGGTMIYWQRHYYGKEAESWLSKHSQEKQYSSLANLLKRFLNKR
jgi:Na+-driven multidrug efflux pump